MNPDEIHTDIVDSTGSIHADVPRSGRRITGAIVGAAVAVAVAVGLVAALHADRLPEHRGTGTATVRAGAPGSMLSHEQVPSWRASTSATVDGRSHGSLTAEQVPSWSPTASPRGQTYREQVPAGS